MTPVLGTVTLECPKCMQSVRFDFTDVNQSHTVPDHECGPLTVVHLRPDSALAPASEMTPLCRDRSQELVDAVLADPEWKDKSADKRLAEVMRRSKGSVNPRTVWFLLTGSVLK